MRTDLGLRLCAQAFAIIVFVGASACGDATGDPAAADTSTADTGSDTHQATIDTATPPPDTTTCTPDCNLRQCGDDGCGGSCGTCTGMNTCDKDGICRVTACIPGCEGKECGVDRCGNNCGTCPTGESCDGDGQCVTGCTPACDGRACGDDGCGGSCGTCTGGETCDASGQCGGACAPNCLLRQCGDDGCGGTCGTCTGTNACGDDGICRPPACVPACDGKSCGGDGCGGSCGSCTGSDVCIGGTCLATCLPACDGKSCGGDGCGGSCGSCDGSDVCTDGVCITPCVPACDGKSCGGDGCGGSCGSCAGSEVCTDGVCITPCVPACDGKSCGGDGCGGSCGSCAGSDVCTDGVCITPCVPACDGKNCGDDGCGGTCGSCTGPDLCTDGVCITPCVPACDGKNCGDDGCGGSCGSCAGSDVCTDGACITPCVPACDGKNCGDDGCGGTCGSCTGADLCTDGVCVTPCAPSCDGKQCGDDGCGGTCGDCAASFVCDANQCTSPEDYPPTTTATISPRYVYPGEAANLIVDVTDLNSDLDLGLDDIVAVRVDLSAVTGDEDDIVDLIPGDASGRQSRTFTANIDTAGLLLGAYPLRVTATDASGREAHDTVALVVYTGAVLTVGPSGSYANIKSAVTAANIGDWVQIAPGTYTGNLNKNVVLSGKEILIASTGTAADTIVDCEGAGRVFNVTDSASSATIIAGLTLTNCAAAAVRVEGTAPEVALALTLVDAALTHNTNSDYGGALRVSGPIARVTLYDVTATDNSYANGGGGVALLSSATGVSEDGVFLRNNNSLYVYSGSSMRVRGGRFEEHTTGNAIDANASTLTLDLVRVAQNLKTGVSVAGGKLTIMDSVFTENGTLPAVRHFGGGNLVCERSTFAGNAGRGLKITSYGDTKIVRDGVFANNLGGGLEVDYGMVLVDRVVFRANQAAHGAGIDVYERGSITVTDSSFIGNRADTWGGAIRLTPSSSSAGASAIAGVLFVDNAAKTGAAISLGVTSTAPVTASTFVRNVAENPGGVHAEYGHVNIRSSVFADTILYAKPSSQTFVTIADTLLADEDVIDDGLRINDGDGYYTGGNGNIPGPALFVSGPRGDYYLSQTGAGQALTSPGVDPANGPLVTDTPAVQGRTTRTDGVVDSGTVDMGYHYLP